MSSFMVAAFASHPGGKIVAVQRRQHIVFGGLAIVASALVLTACDQVNGGGTMASLVPGQKANFGFSAKCRTVTSGGVSSAQFYNGQFEFHDDAVGVAIHGDVTPDASSIFTGTTCADMDQVAESMGMNFTRFQGTYRDQHDPGTGRFEVTVTDNGEPGTNDMLCVTLTPATPPAIPYANCGAGTISSGNIQVH
jgi:hypothetical protein